MLRLMDIHPDLAKLRSEYERIIADFEHGHIAEPEATELLANMRVFDANGAAWGIDLYGMFTRQAGPDSQVENASPSLYSSAQASSSWNRQVETESFDSGPTPTWGDSTAQVGAADTYVQTAAEDTRAKSLRVQSFLQKLSGRFSGSDVLAKNKTTLIVVAVLVLLLLTFNLVGGSDKKTPSEISATQQIVDLSTVAPERMTAILTALQDPAQVQSITIEPVDEPLAMHVAAYWRGMSQVASPVSATAAGISVSSAGKELFFVPWSFVLDGDTVKLFSVRSLLPSS
jgi:hypothetical protein